MKGSCILVAASVLAASTVALSSSSAGDGDVVTFNSASNNSNNNYEGLNSLFGRNGAPNRNTFASSSDEEKFAPRFDGLSCRTGSKVATQKLDIFDKYDLTKMVVVITKGKQTKRSAYCRICFEARKPTGRQVSRVFVHAYAKVLQNVVRITVALHRIDRHFG